MSYTVRVKGSSSFRTVDLLCPKCEYEEERTIDLRDLDGDDREKAMIVQCPNCEHPEMERIWKKAPSAKVGNDRSDENIAKMKKSFKERFVKKELDDVRHRSGKLFDDSIRSAAAQRIKKGLKSDYEK